MRTQLRNSGGNHSPWFPLTPAPLILVCGCASNWFADGSQPTSRPPEVYVVSPQDDDHFAAGKTVVVSALVVDDLDEPASLPVSVRSEAGELASGFPDKLGQFTAEVTLPEGAVQLWVEAEDSEHQAVRGFVRVAIDAVFATPADVTLVPESPETGEPVEARLLTDAVFEDGSPFTYTYAWSVDGLLTEFTEPTLPADVVRAGEVWEVAVTAHADQTVSEPGRAFATIGNAGPAVGEPTVAEDGEMLRCAHPEPFDPEGDTLTVRYHWAVDGERLDDREATIPPPAAPRGAELTCEVSVADGEERAVAESAPWPVPNHDPSVGVPEVIPTAPGTDDVLTCSVPEADDPDGDALLVEFVWRVGGVEVGAGPTLDGEAFARGDGVECLAFADDGQGGGASGASGLVEVVDTPPSAPTVAITPEAPITGETLQCVVTGGGIDRDGDAVGCTTRWEIGTPFADGESLVTSGFRAGTPLTCAVSCTAAGATGPAGRATVTLGDAIAGETATGDAMVRVTGPAPGAGFGAAVAVLPDLDGDGAVDLGVGAPGSDGGAVYLYTSASLRGAESLDVGAASASWLGADSGDLLGAAGSLADAGDIDGDGDHDLVLGGPESSFAGPAAGRAWLLAGGTPLGLDLDVDAASAWAIAGEPGDRLGERVAGGDLDGDGLAEVVLSARGSALGGSGAGAVVVVAGTDARPGGTADLADADALLVGAPDEGLGTALAVCPDADGDGTAELVVGAAGASPDGRARAGSVVSVPGPAVAGFGEVAAHAWLKAGGDAAGDELGTALACPGDLDDDGLGDLLVGAPRVDHQGTDAGVVAVYFGRPEGDLGLGVADADARFFGAGADARLGSVVTSAGDLDHDGLVDLLAGAPGAGAGAGLVEVYRALGVADWSPDGGTADASIAGNTETQRIGEALAGGLDLEGDGFAELAMGTPLAQESTGAVYVFSGR